MAVGKLLYVKGSTNTTITGVRALTINAKCAILQSVGDNALGLYAGRAQPITGSAIFEDITTAKSAIGTKVASVAFACADSDAGDASFTFTNFIPLGISSSVDDGLADGQVPGVSVDYVADSVSVA